MKKERLVEDVEGTHSSRLKKGHWKGRYGFIWREGYIDVEGTHSSRLKKGHWEGRYGFIWREGHIYVKGQQLKQF